MSRSVPQMPISWTRRRAWDDVGFGVSIWSSLMLFLTPGVTVRARIAVKQIQRSFGFFQVFLTTQTGSSGLKYSCPSTLYLSRIFSFTSTPIPGFFGTVAYPFSILCSSLTSCRFQAGKQMYKVSWIRKVGIVGFIWMVGAFGIGPKAVWEAI